MLDSIKNLWARWKVQVSVVGGVLIIGTAYGTCTYEAPALEEPATETTETTEATETTETTETTEAAETTETTATETTVTETTATETTEATTE